MKRAFMALALVTLFVAPAHAGINEGVAAWKRGDHVTALREFRPLAEQGNARAQYYLGRMYLQGRVVARDEAEAEKWFCLAAEQGDKSAVAALAMMEPKGQEGRKSARGDKGALATSARSGFDEGVAAHKRNNYASALREFQPLAEQGNADAQYYLGLMYTEGQGVKRDFAEGAKWYRLAAEQGNTAAQFGLSTLYTLGKGVSQDNAEARKWYLLATKSDARAQHSQGQGVAQDDAEAVKRDRLAAEQGNVEAQIKLAAMYEKGRGIARDEAEAAKWYRAAAERGDAKAQNVLGILYAEGQGVARDLVEAYRWFALAASQDSVEIKETRDKAAYNRDLAATKMTPAEIDRARTLAREFKPIR